MKLTYVFEIKSKCLIFTHSNIIFFIKIFFYANIYFKTFNENSVDLSSQTKLK